MEAFKFRNANHVFRAIGRWCNISKRERCDAICKQHGLADATQIWDRDSRGKCIGEATFVGECDDEMICFTYWGIVMIGYWQLDGDCTLEEVVEALDDPYCTQECHQN